MKNDVGPLSGAKGTPLARIASELGDSICRRALHCVGVTGPSSVGKSTFAGDVARRLRENDRSVETIRLDDFLRGHLRGTDAYRADSRDPLHPQDFEFREVAQLVAALTRGDHVEKRTYRRGFGWTELTRWRQADVYLIEGLFLDSTEASAHLAFDMLVTLEAPFDAIAQLRRTRDEVVRSATGGNFRSHAETEDEIRRTRDAYLAYERAPFANRVVIEVDSRFRVESLTLDASMNS